MTTTTSAGAALEAALDALPLRHPGPGGVAGIVRDGRVIARRAWGHADLDSALPMTAGTPLPVCSITKQFTCMALLATVADPARLDGRIAAFLPRFTGPLPAVRHLCDNQSGLRDYWALTVLQGGRAEQVFAREDALPLIARMRTGHFAPGTGYSYSNGNYRILAELIEAETASPLEDVVRRHVWAPAGMATAAMTADTRIPAGGVTGYEGNDATGWLPAVNAIWWSGDAGMSASLDDMLAYECWIDATRDDAGGLYPRISVHNSFADGQPASYGYGLARRQVAGLAVTGHGSALRGFRAHRLHAADARLSVVVMFNHDANARAAADALMEAALGHAAPPPAPVPEGWDGQWIAPDGLLVRIETGKTGATLHHATGAEVLQPGPEDSLIAPGIAVTRDAEGPVLRRITDNSTLRLQPLPRVETGDGAELAGRYFSDELDAGLEIEARDGATHARFSGLLGTGRWERMAPVGRDTWIVATRRSMDAPAPGDWTLRVHRSDGAVTGLTLGCWLARGIGYRRA